MIILKIFGAMILVNFIWIAYKDLRQSYESVKESEEAWLRERRTRAFIAQQERELKENVRNYLNSGKRIDAIKECKDYYECSLSRAKTIVSEIEFEMAYEKAHEDDEYSYPCTHESADSAESMGQQQCTPPCNPDIDGMEGHKFEYFCADLLLKNGFDKADVTPGSGDQGVDIIAVKDGIKYAIQCKNYKTPLGNTAVQEVHTGKDYYNCHVAVVMTNSSFTPGAQKLADANRVLLWDRAYIERLMEKAGIDKTISKPSNSELKTINEDPDKYQTSNGQQHESGNSMGEDMLFSQNCGMNSAAQTSSNDMDHPDTRGNTYSEQSDTPSSQAKPYFMSYEAGIHNQPQQTHTAANTLRGSMKMCMIVCIVFATMYVLIGAVIGDANMAVGLGGLFAVLAVMFFVLAKSPKENPFILGKQRGLKKSLFVLICVVIAFLIVSVCAGTASSTASQADNGTNTSQTAVDTQDNNDTLSNQAAEMPESADDVKP